MLIQLYSTISVLIGILRKNRYILAIILFVLFCVFCALYVYMSIHMHATASSHTPLRLPRATSPQGEPWPPLILQN